MTKRSSKELAVPAEWGLHCPFGQRRFRCLLVCRLCAGGTCNTVALAIWSGREMCRAIVCRHKAHCSLADI